MPNKFEPNIFYIGARLSLKIQIKERKEEEHKHELVHHAKCAECNENYMGETGRTLRDCVAEHTVKQVKQF